MSFFIQTLLFPTNFLQFFEFKEEYAMQYSKNYNILKKVLRNQTKNSLEFDHFMNACHSLFYCEANTFIDLFNVEDPSSLYVLVSLLSIYEVDKNLSHFDFVYFF